MKTKTGLIWLAIFGLAVSILACNAPTSTPQVPPISPPQETATSPPSETPPGATHTPTPMSQTDTETPLPTETEPPPTETPTPTPTRPPVSTGPLDFPIPGALDHWQSLPSGKMEAMIILHITGGALPYTIYHDAGLVTITWENEPEIVFQARGCSALVHTITVESADGQSVQHDYWIPVPWCD